MSTNYSTWKTINLGTGFRNGDSMCKAIRGVEMIVGTEASDILGKPAFRVTRKPTKVGLVVLSIAELGFTKEAKLKRIYRAAKNRGLKLCLSEVGPQLRLQYPDQPMDEWINIAMRPITNSSGLPTIFCIGNYSDGRCLYSYYESPNCYWSTRHRFAFMVSRK